MTGKITLSVLALIPFLVSSVSFAQPIFTKEGVLFTIEETKASQVYLAGEFNGWSPTANPMAKGKGGLWSLVLKLDPGIYQYKFVIDGKIWKEDPHNPSKVDDNYGGFNSVLTVTEKGEVLLEGFPLEESKSTESYPPEAETLYLNIIWHQHQPLYLDPLKDQLQGPWVRCHSTKDYYDMASIIRGYPDVHMTINLTSSLLLQLERYYVERLKDFVDVKHNRVDIKGYFAKYGGKTDPWIDLALKKTEDFTQEDKGYLYLNNWNCFSTSDVMIERFPQYLGLKNKPTESLTTQDLREIKFWFYLVWFDPDFLRGKANLPLGYNVDLSDLVEEREGKFFLKRRITEADCQRMVAEAYKVMANVIPIHKELSYHPEEHTGQIEVITTPFYHPILPLLIDTDVARECQPADKLPSRFSYPHDANAQVAKAVKYFQETFGQPLRGMWPGEGSVSQGIVPLLVKNGIRWAATADKVLYRSSPQGGKIYYPYQVDGLTLVFRDTPLSDKIGFRYQNYLGQAAADDFIRSLIRYAPPKGEPDRLLSVILDGENAWEWYRKDPDGKGFLHSLYSKLEELYQTRQIVTVTPTEYIMGNPERDVPPHPVSEERSLTHLWPGSWINADFSTWIGEPQENGAWEYLLRARRDLANSGVKPPDPKLDPPSQGTRSWYEYMAWEEMYAAEGSDWFWWYGSDQNAPGGDGPFDRAFRTHLGNIYLFLQKAGIEIKGPGFPPLIDQ